MDCFNVSSSYPSPTLCCGLIIVGLNLRQIRRHQSIHLSIGSLFVRKQRVDILQQCPLHRSVPRLGRTPAHGRHRFPVVVHEGNDVPILAEHHLRFAFLGRRLLQIGNGCHAHLRNRGLGLPEAFQPRYGTVLTDEHIVHNEGHQSAQLEPDAGFVEPTAACHTKQFHYVEIPFLSAEKV